MRNKDKTKTNFPTPLLSSQKLTSSFPLFYFIFLFSEKCKGMENRDEEWGLWTVHNTLFCMLLQSVSLLQCRLFFMGDSPSWIVPIWFLSMGCMEQTAPVWVPYRVTGLAKKPAPSAAAFHGLQLLPSCRNLFLHEFSMDCIFLQSTSTCCGIGFFVGSIVVICSNMVLCWLQVDNMLHHGLLHGLQRDLCSDA